jgi:hypothetical protein
MKNVRKTWESNYFCDYNFDPVCGCNKKAYGNACSAECNGITIYKRGNVSSVCDSIKPVREDISALLKIIV